jgi:hypothetical protein
MFLVHKAVSVERTKRQAQDRRSASRESRWPSSTLGTCRKEAVDEMVWSSPGHRHHIDLDLLHPEDEEREVHASRLKFYADSSLDVSGELLEHAAHNSESHVVDRILGARNNASHK